ncbi:hypothetical protein BU17DRAFT_43208 [Hysterangium stoloniferum]|nr:hypothetical protein BU17DRAFT_43208 [Hysterangium stoloniferum]
MVLSIFPAIIVLSLGLCTLWSLFQKKLRATLSPLEDLSLLGEQRLSGQRIRGTALVCGGSIAGLLTAKVCSEHFENVIIVEAEDWLSTPEGLEDRHRDPNAQKRSRVPQYTSLHGFQPFATMALRKMFNYFDAEVRKSGARFVPFDLQAHYSGTYFASPLHQYADGALPSVPLLTRPAFETILRRLVLTCPNVQCIPGTVVGMNKEPYFADMIGSVQVRSSSGDEITIPATLVADCTGPALAGLRWLKALAPASDKSLESLKTTYNPKMSYTTCEFYVDPILLHPLKALGVPADYETAGVLYLYFPDSALDNKCLIIARREGNFLQMICGGWDAHEQITNIDDIMMFLLRMNSASPLPHWIQLMLTLFKQETVPTTFAYARAPPSVYVRYYQAQNLPSNFIAIGDSVLQLNPIRGQGCTKACVEAVSLNALLSRCSPLQYGSREVLPNNFGREFFDLQATRTGFLWDLYKSDDYAWQTTVPTKGDNLHTSGAWRRAYGSLLMRLVVQDREVAAVWWHVLSWLAPPTDLMTPMILFKVAWISLQEHLKIEILPTWPTLLYKYREVASRLLSSSSIGH